MTLADDTVVDVPVHRASVVWDGAARRIPVHRLSGTPLVGMGLVFGYKLTLEGRANGAVRLELLVGNS